MNCGFEDCVALDNLLHSSGLLKKLEADPSLRLQFGDFESIFEEFHAVRKPSADAIANLALENFVEKVFAW